MKNLEGNSFSDLTEDEITFLVEEYRDKLQVVRNERTRRNAEKHMEFRKSMVGKCFSMSNDKMSPAFVMVTEINGDAELKAVEVSYMIDQDDPEILHYAELRADSSYSHDEEDVEIPVMTFVSEFVKVRSLLNLQVGNIHHQILNAKAAMNIMRNSTYGAMGNEVIKTQEEK